MITVLHFPQGRLGNLLFQLVAAKEAVDGPVRVITLASEATDYFIWDKNFWILPCPRYLRTRIVLIWIYILRILSMLKIVGTITPELVDLSNGYTSEGTNIKINKGFFSNIYVLVGFFQHDKFTSLIPKLRNKEINDAELNLKNIAVKSRRVAVHLRFGDYNSFCIYGIEGTQTPLAYYINAFKMMESKVESPTYVVFSDDRQKANQLLNQTGRNFSFYEGKDPIGDFTAMASCSHAILSASTFAWWAAFLIQNPNKVVIAPEFWLGFKSQCWFPAYIKTKSFTYVSVL